MININFEGLGKNFKNLAKAGGTFLLMGLSFSSFGKGEKPNNDTEGINELKLNARVIGVTAEKDAPVAEISLPSFEGGGDDGDGEGLEEENKNKIKASLESDGNFENGDPPTTLVLKGLKFKTGTTELSDLYQKNEILRQIEIFFSHERDFNSLQIKIYGTYSGNRTFEGNETLGVQRAEFGKKMLLSFFRTNSKFSKQCLFLNDEEILNKFHITPQSKGLFLSKDQLNLPDSQKEKLMDDFQGVRFEISAREEMFTPSDFEGVVMVGIDNSGSMKDNFQLVQDLKAKSGNSFEIFETKTVNVNNVEGGEEIEYHYASLFSMVGQIRPKQIRGELGPCKIVYITDEPDVSPLALREMEILMTDLNKTETKTGVPLPKIQTELHLVKPSSGSGGPEKVVVLLTEKNKDILNPPDYAKTLPGEAQVKAWWLKVCNFQNTVKEESNAGR